MIIYILRRILLTLITLLILTFISFSLIYFSFGSTLTSEPAYKAYFFYLYELCQGNLGKSGINNETLTQKIISTLPVTLELCVWSLIVAFIIGVPLAILSGIYRNKLIDKCTNIFVLLANAIPTFWLALLSLVLFSYYLDWIPNPAHYNPNYAIIHKTGFLFIDAMLLPHAAGYSVFVDIFKHMSLPVFVLSLSPMSEIIHLLRQSVVNVSKQNYVKAAASRGLSRFVIIHRHILHNAFPPVIPQFGIQFSTLLTLTMVVEIIYQWPGIGNSLFYALRHQDYQTISAGILVLGALVILVNFVTDIIGSISNPLKYKELYVH